MQTEAQRKATAKYRKASVKQIILRFYPAEMELYEKCKNLGTPKIKEVLHEVCSN